MADREKAQFTMSTSTGTGPLKDTKQMSQRVVMACYFYPRGGSAQVVRYLTSRLKKSFNIQLYTGSLGEAGSLTNASTFYAGMDPIQLDYSKAELEWQNGGDPMLAEPPMQGSFEDRPGVADIFLAKLNPDLAGRQVSAWRRLFSLEEKEPDIVHLHHLTPMHDAAFDLWKNATVVTHLHGTELKMIETIRETRGLKFGEWWIDHMRTSADRSRLIITVSPQERNLALDLLSVPLSKVVTIPNGVDVDVFRQSILSDDERLSHWRRWLVADPQGWVPNGSPGSVKYSDADLGLFRNADGSLAPILLFVGRFTAFKRIDVLLDAYEMFRANSEHTAPLVIWGGFPGEWEGEHPYETVQRRGIVGVFFAGWRGHDDLPLALASADVFVAPSVNEPFGQVYLEAMSCGLPVIATSTGGPKSFVNVESERETGWLVKPGDALSLMSAISEAVESRSLRDTRGRNARLYVSRKFSWDGISDQVARAYEDVILQQ